MVVHGNQYHLTYPKNPVNIVVQDIDNKDLLWLATDGGVYLSINSGKKWINFNQNIPSVPIKDLEIQEREDDLVLGTYGRGVYSQMFLLSNNCQIKY
ncbi:MAG: hypothetical protein Ct9H300mP18_11280 [Candidatus Neomarinimicrobiota bacterium]|nr:MAG: hypothetical protein Ct9H300mP18_11280 [Candidatus Neomarinimicrobiota bacterium]